MCVLWRRWRSTATCTGTRGSSRRSCTAATRRTCASRTRTPPRAARSLAPRAPSSASASSPGWCTARYAPERSVCLLHASPHGTPQSSGSSKRFTMFTWLLSLSGLHCEWGEKIPGCSPAVCSTINYVFNQQESAKERQVLNWWQRHK